MPPGASDPSTGPWDCWTTWAARGDRPLARRRTRVVVAAPEHDVRPDRVRVGAHRLGRLRRAASVCTRTSSNDVPNADSIEPRVPSSSGVPPPEPTTSWTGERSSSLASIWTTPWLPAVRWRRMTDATSSAGWRAGATRPARRAAVVASAWAGELGRSVSGRLSRSCSKSLHARVLLWRVIRSMSGRYSPNSASTHQPAELPVLALGRPDEVAPSPTARSVGRREVRGRHADVADVAARQLERGGPGTSRSMSSACGHASAAGCAPTARGGRPPRASGSRRSRRAGA